MSSLRFGPFELDCSVGELRRSGAPIRLSPQPLKLLILLASRAGEVVSREDICARLWGTDTFVDFDQGVNHCIHSIRTALTHGPGSPVYIETVPGRGYRFAAAVFPRPAETASPTPPAGIPLTPEQRVLLADRHPEPRGGWTIVRWFSRLRFPSLRPELGVRLAILPFDNLSSHEGLSCGLTEEIGTHLSRTSGERLRLVSSSSAKLLKQTPDPIWAARNNRVDFLLDGNVRSNAARARVNARLVRVRDETQLWTESYDRTMDDVFDFQTEVARAIAEGARVRLGT